MELLLLLPLIFAWNFLFWGTIGLIRCAGETIDKHQSWLVSGTGSLACVFLLVQSPGLFVGVLPFIVTLTILVSIAAMIHLSKSFVRQHSDVIYEKSIARISRPAIFHPPGTIFRVATPTGSSDAACNRRNDDAYKLINSWLMKLDPSNRDIIVRRLGLYGHYKTTLKEISLETGVSCRHVREVQVDALRKLQQVQLDLDSNKKLFNVVANEYNRARIASSENNVSEKMNVPITWSNVEDCESQTQSERRDLPIAQTDPPYPNEMLALVAVMIATVCIAPFWQMGVLGNLSMDTPFTMAFASVAVSLWVFVVLFAGRVLAGKYMVQPASQYSAGDANYRMFSKNHVAVLVPAYNEGAGIEPTIRSAVRLVRRENVFVVNDCSTDDTSKIVAKLGVNLLDLTTNMGKANALDTAIKFYDLCDKFQFLLILDADTEIDPHYLKYALPKFDNPEVSVVAGHAIPKWSKEQAYRWSSFYVAYRIKLYMMTQAFLRYGQTSMHLNVSFIVPGFSSIYRTSVIPEIEITAPGLVIEDFNMTFELHRKKLGKIAYSPNAVAYCHEPHSFSDYTSQIKRWHLGFWQTVRRHGFWKSTFSFALSLFVLESLIISLAFISLPFVGVNAVVSYFSSSSFLPISQSVSVQVFFIGVLIVFLLDMASTVVVAVITKKPALLWHGVFFFLLRWVDAFYFVVTIPMAFIVKSNGRWISPSRLPSQ